MLKRRRVLWGKHIFVCQPCFMNTPILPLTWRQMITISGVLGIGFYTRSGIILRAAGPLALVLAFSLLTALAWGVMQCITEMLSIWPVPGALVEFVGTFLDKDLGTTVGVAYWYVSYSGFWSLHCSELWSVVHILPLILRTNTIQVHLCYYLACFHYRYSWRLDSSKSN